MTVKPGQARGALLDPLFQNNPIALQVLGICSALAVTTTLHTALLMTLAVIAVMAFSNSPEDGSIVQRAWADLTWSCTDPDGDDLTFDVYFGVQTSPPRVRENLAVEEHKVLGLTVDQSYYWKVVARDPGGLEASSTVLSFTVSN